MFKNFVTDLHTAMSHQEQESIESSSKLWMGDLEPYMDENFLKSVFAFFGYHVQGIKWIQDRHTRANARYCFVVFNDPIVAKQVLEKLSNQLIPGSEGKQFKLNWASRKVEGGQQDYTVFVGDLSKDVTSQMLQDFFQQRYSSVRYAKVMEDENGYSKGYGFVRFLDEAERNGCYTHLNGATGLGKKAITIREAFAPKQRSSYTMPSTSSQQAPLLPLPTTPTPTPTPMLYSPIYSPLNAYPQTIWSSGMALDPTQQQQQQQSLYAPGYQYPHTGLSWGSSARIDPSMYQSHLMNYGPVAPVEDLEEPNVPLDVEGINKVIFLRERDLYTQLDSTRWSTNHVGPL